MRNFDKDNCTAFEDANLIHADYSVMDNVESDIDGAGGDFLTEEAKAEIIAAEAAEALAEEEAARKEMGL